MGVDQEDGGAVAGDDICVILAGMAELHTDLDRVSPEPGFDDGDFTDTDPSPHIDKATTEPAATPAQHQQWIEAMARGDERALGLLYDATVGRVYGLALRITRHPQIAEEVTEDVYWQAWRQAARFDPHRGQVSTWLNAMARSRALDQLRRQDTATSHPDPQILSEHEDQADSPQDLVAATEAHHALHHALAGLDALPRQLLSLSFFRGLSHDEIASQTALPLGTVKSHIRRALLALRNTLAAEPWADLKGIA